jgi:hypothetical protein
MTEKGPPHERKEGGIYLSSLQSEDEKMGSALMLILGGLPSVYVSEQ